MDARSPALPSQAQSSSAELTAFRLFCTRSHAVKPRPWSSLIDGQGFLLTASVAWIVPLWLSGITVG
jgi:hypothetical protein